MWFFKKKKESVKNTEDRELIEMNSKMVDALIVLSSNEEFDEQLKDLKEKLKYLVPSTDEKVLKGDKKIKEALQDLKIALSKNGDVEENAKVKNLFKDVEVLIAERNMYV